MTERQTSGVTIKWLHGPAYSSDAQLRGTLPSGPHYRLLEFRTLASPNCNRFVAVADNPKPGLRLHPRHQPPPWRTLRH